MSWHYLQEQEEACWPHACLDGAPNALWNLMPLLEGSSWGGPLFTAPRDGHLDGFQRRLDWHGTYSGD